MSLRRRNLLALLLVATTLAALTTHPAPARAGLIDKACSVIGTLGEGWWGKACNALTHAKQVTGAAKSVATGKAGKAVKVLMSGAARNVLSPSGAVGIAAIVAWAVGGAHFVLAEIAKFVNDTTSPELTAAWFASVYWRVAGVAALLTLPFLCAAAIQAVMRSDLALLARAVFGYLPLSFLATGVAAPTTMMLLAVTDWMSGSVSRAAGDQGAHFLAVSGAAIGALGIASGSPFVTFLIALLTAAGGLVLWLELLIREAAVYVVVLMLPLVFAAMVWPARRVWAIRAVEVLVALILAKFAIVSVLSLAAAALGHGGGSFIVRSLAGLVLVTLGAFAPWVLLRLLPLAEVAAAAAGHVRGHAQARLTADGALARQGLMAATAGTAGLMGRMRGLADDANTAAWGASGPAARSAATAQLARVTATPDAAGLSPDDLGGEIRRSGRSSPQAPSVQVTTVSDPPVTTDAAAAGQAGSKTAPPEPPTVTEPTPKAPAPTLDTGDPPPTAAPDSDPESPA